MIRIVEALMVLIVIMSTSKEGQRALTNSLISIVKGSYAKQQQRVAKRNS